MSYLIVQQVLDTFTSKCYEFLSNRKLIDSIVKMKTLSCQMVCHRGSNWSPILADEIYSYVGFIQFISNGRCVNVRRGSV